MRIGTIFGLVCLSLFGAANGFAQSYQGGVRGAVSDTAGAIIPGVEVALINEGTNVSRETVTNETGQYVFASVSPGTYKLRASLAGFKTYERSGLTIGTQQFVTLDIRLEIGVISDEVSVIADSPLIETSSANTATALPQQILSTLPNTGRNAFMMALTVPTVVHVGDPFYVRQQDQTNATRMSLGGGPIRGNNYLIDGVPVTDLRNRTAFFPNIEAVEEVKVQVNTYDSEMGRTGGGVFNTTMRSGTNQWHFEGHLQNRPWQWKARNFFETTSDGSPFKRVEFDYWLYGGSAGGPIFKDKTFFWATTEGYKTGTPWTLKMQVPTALEKQGDFSQTRTTTGAPIVIYDPTTTRTDPNNPGRFIRDPFPNNVIPANRINPVARQLMQFWPAPKSTPANAFGADNFINTDVLHDIANQFTVKVDHTFNTKHMLAGTLAWYDSKEPFQLHFRGTPAEIADRNNYKLFRTVWAPVLNYTWTPDPTTVITARYGTNTFDDDCLPLYDDYDLGKLGFDSAYVSALQTKLIPRINLSDGFREIGSNTNIHIKWISHNLLGNYSKFFGRHNFKAGGAYRQIGVDFFDLSTNPGTFTFNRIFTQLDPNVANSAQGHPIASLLLGYPASGSIEVATPLQFYTRYYAGYFQDDFRFSTALTINMGLRYEYETDIMEKNNHLLVGFDRNAKNPIADKVTDPVLRDRIKGGLMYAGVNGYKTHQGDPQTMKWQPRIGLAWSASSKTVVRAGYGVFYAPLQLFFPSNNAFGALGFSSSTDFLASTDSNRTPADNLTNPFPRGFQQPTGSSKGLLQNVGDSVTFIDQDNKHGYVHQYSMDIQRELPGNVIFTIGYVGSKSLKLSVGGTNSSTVNINQLPNQLLSMGTQLQQSVSNPFFGIPEAGSLGRSSTTTVGQLLRPFPQFLNVNMVRPSLGYGNYNSLIVKAERRVDRLGFGFRTSYTWAKMLENYFGESNFYGQRLGTAVDNFDLNKEYGLSFNDVPHRFNVTPMWDLPLGKGKRWASSGLADKIVGGWNISPVINLQSGFPASIYYTSTASNQNLGGGQRPNMVVGVSPCTSGSATDRLGNWFDKNAFAAAAPFTVGNAPRTLPDCRLPHQFNMDLAIRKNFKVGEVNTVSFRLEALNATNTAKFQAPESRYDNSAFGRVVAQAGFPRIIQWMIRYQY